MAAPAPARDRALRSALRSLAAREHSAQELRDKLRGKFGPGLAAETVGRLERDGLVSDERFAEAYVRSKTGRLGAQRIRRELRERGVGRELAEAATAGIGDEETEAGHALDALRKRFREGVGSAEDRARAHRFLASRGFPPRAARKAIGRHGGEDED